jgi:hypothetical protein
MFQLEGGWCEGGEPATPGFELPAKGTMRLEQLGPWRFSDPLLEPPLGQGEHTREARADRASACHGPGL